MIYFGKEKAQRIWIGRKAVSVLYSGAEVIWRAIRSCFGNGHWVGLKPWIGEDKWKNE